MEAQRPLLSNTAAFVLLTGKLKAHTHFHSRKSYQTLSKTFSAPLNTLPHIEVHAQFQNHLCPIRISYLPLVCPLWLKFSTTHLLFLFNNDPKPAVSFRFNLHIRSLAINGTGQVSEHKNACFNALPPSVSHFNGTAQFSDILCPDFKCFQTLNPSFLVHMLPSKQP